MNMTPLKRKLLLLEKGKTISGLARKRKAQLRSQIDFEVLRKQLSMCIHGDREYPHLRQFIAHELDQPVEQLFEIATTSNAA